VFGTEEVDPAYQNAVNVERLNTKVEHKARDDEFPSMPWRISMEASVSMKIATEVVLANSVLARR
jgi:hypothetical protein